VDHAFSARWSLSASLLLNTNQVRRTPNGTGFRYASTDYLETQVVRLGEF
jgi:hypothetical protein